MATTIATGYNARMAMRTAVTWAGTTTQVPNVDPSWSSYHANEIPWGGLFFTSENIQYTAPTLENPAITGTSPMQFIGKVGEKRCEGPVSFSQPYYQGMERLFAIFMGEHVNAAGTAGAPTQQGAASAYYGFFTLANDMEGVMGVLVLHMDVLIGTASDSDEVTSALKEIPSFKVDQFSLTWSGGANIVMEFTILGSGMNVAAENENNGFDSNNPLSPVYESARVVMLPQDLKLFLADASADTPIISATADAKLDVVSFNMTWSRNLDRQISTSKAPEIDEPVSGGFSVTGTIGVNKFNISELETFPQFDQFHGKTEKVLAGYFESATTIATNLPYVWGFVLPSVLFGDMSANIGGPGRVAFNVGFAAYEATTARVVIGNVPNATLPIKNNANGISTATPLMFYQSGSSKDPLLPISGTRFTA